MIGDEKNLKDSKKDLKDKPVLFTNFQAVVFGLGNYNKTEKLITALYMVTDIMDKDEPLRNKLRTLGANIISDIYSLSVFSDTAGYLKTGKNITEIISFLNIATTINIISVMNNDILQKEFFELKKSIDLATKGPNLFDKQTNLLEFLKDELSSNEHDPQSENFISIGHKKPTRIGVQRGETLMKALSDIESNNNGHVDYIELKQERRNEIITIIKDTEASNNYQGCTITDIKLKAKGILVLSSEKTLQRELVSMVKENILSKTGSKRWSRYSQAKLKV